MGEASSTYIVNNSTKKTVSSRTVPQVEPIKAKPDPKPAEVKKKKSKYANFKPAEDLFDAFLSDEEKKPLKEDKKIKQVVCDPSYFEAMKKPYLEFIKDLKYMKKHKIDLELMREFKEDIDEKLQRGKNTEAALLLSLALKKPYDEFMKDLKNLENGNLTADDREAFADLIRKKKEEGLGPAARTNVRKLLQSKAKDPKRMADLSKRDPSDLAGIAGKVRESAILKNKTKRYDRRMADKAIDTTRRSNKNTCILDQYDKEGNFTGEKASYNWKEEQKKIKESMMKAQPKPHYTRKEKTAFREAFLRSKAAKHKRKKARQALRKEEEEKEQIITESGEIETQAEYFGQHVPDFIVRGIALAVPAVLESCTGLISDYPTQFQTLLMIHQLIYSPGPVADASIIWSYINFLGVPQAWKDLEDPIRMWRIFRPTSVATESLADTLDFMSSNMTMVLSSKAAMALQQIVMILASWHFFDKNVYAKVVNWVGKPVQSTIPETCVMILSSVASLVRVVEATIDGAPMCEIFSTADPLRQALFKAGSLVARAPNVYYGLPVPGHMCAKEFMAESDPVVKSLEYLHEKMNPFSPNSVEVEKALNVLVTTRTAIKSVLAGGVRAAPICFVIFGPPGIGKSAVLQFIARLHSRIKGRKFEPTHIFERVMSSDFWDGYNTFSTPYIHYSEMGTLKAAIAKARGDDALAELTSVVDQLPHSVNMSAVGEKGTNFINPEAVFIDTNVVDMNLPHTVNNPTAFYRRMIYIRPYVKEKYCIPGTEELDKDRYPEDDFYDKWNFTVTKRHPISLEDFTTEFLLNAGDADSDIFSLTKVLATLITNDITSGKLVADRTVSGFDEIMKKIYPMTEAGMVFDEKEEVEEKYAADPDPEFPDLQEDPGVRNGALWEAREARYANFDTELDDLPIIEDVDENDVSDEESEVSDNEIAVEEYTPTFIGGALNSIAHYLTLLGLPIRFISGVISVCIAIGNNLDVILGYLTMFGSLRAVCTRDNFRKFSTIIWYVLKLWLFIMRTLFSIMRIYMSVFASRGRYVTFAIVNFAIVTFVPAFATTAVIIMIVSTLLFCMWISPTLDRRITATVQWEMSGLRNRYNQAQDYFRGVYDRRNFSNEKCAKWLVGITVSVALIYKLVTYWKSLKIKTESSTFTDMTPLKEKLNEIEEKYDCSDGTVRIPLKGAEKQQMWNTMITATPSVYVGDLKLFRDAIYRNVRHARIGILKTYVLGVAGNCALIHKHAFGTTIRGQLVKIQVAIHGGYYANEDGLRYAETSLYETDLIEVTNDLYLIHLSSINFKNIVSHFPSAVTKIRNVISMIADFDTVSDSFEGPLEVSDKFAGVLRYEQVIEYIWENHTPGACAIPVVGRRDGGCSILGLHSAGSLVDKRAYAIVVTKDMIKAAMRMSYTNGAYLVYSQASNEHGKEPHAKSPVRYEDLGCVSYFGSVATPMMNQKSSLKKSFLARDLPRAFEEIVGYVRSERYTIPMMMPKSIEGQWISPWNNNIRKLAVVKKTLDPHYVMVAAATIINRVIYNLKEQNVQPLQPYTTEVALNGFAEDAFMRRLDMNKAAGHKTPGPKINYVDRYVDDQGKVRDELKDEIIEELIALLECYERMELYGPVYRAQLKDEPRLVDKAKNGKTRVFYATPFAFLLAQRMYLGPLYSLMIQFSACFYTAIGIDMHRQAHFLYDRMKNFAPNIFEGDYGGYDTSMPFDIGVGANVIVLKLLELLGYNYCQLLVCTGLLSDNLFPFVEMIGEMFCVPALQPSGKYATAEDNSIRNLLIMVYIWVTNDKTNDKDFFTYVCPVSYGDDVLASVSDEVKDDFNAITFSKACGEMGLEFTSTSKSAIAEGFVTLETMSFLKRTFVYHKELERIVAPLSLDSIFKSLQWYSPSKVVNEEAQMEQTIQAAMREFFFHLEPESFDKMRGYLIEKFLMKFPKCKISLSTYYELKESLCSDSNLPEQEGRQALESTEVKTQSGDYTYGMKTLVDRCFRDAQRNLKDKLGKSFSRLFPRIQGLTKEQTLNKQLQVLNEKLANLEMEMKEFSDPLVGMSWRAIKMSPRIDKRSALYSSAEVYHNLHNEIRAVKASRKIVVRALTRLEAKDILTQADAGEDVENVQDVGGDVTEMKSTGESRDVDAGQMNVLYLENFLKRPITIAKISLDESVDLTYEVDLWDAFLSNPAVRAKLRNFAYVRGDMRVRIAVSGTPFHYGTLQVSYQPFANNNASLGYLAPQLAGSQRLAALIYLSQAPGVALMRVSDNQPLEMMCEYVNVQPMIRLFNNSPLVISEGTSYNDAVGLGKLYINTLNQVRSASDTPTQISIFVYASMENIELGTTTGTVIEVATQAGDEREVGPVESFATRASEFAAHLTKVPVIGPFAQASEIFFEGAAAIASLFGFSVPTMNNEPVRVKNEPYANGAQIIGYDTGKRITLDPMQELSVDPRATGVSTDDMSIAAMTGRVSLLDTFEWSVSDLSLQSGIWMVPVSPMIAKRFSLGGFPEEFVVAPTALAFASAPFEYWRGDIVFHFQIICSKFHRGKLAFYYEPNIAQNGLIDTELLLNEQFVKIIDIQETTDVSFTVKWAAPKAWMRNLTIDLLGDIGTIGFLGNGLFNFANGYMAVVPFTTLQSPNDTSVQVNVYVSAPEMRFNQMVETRFPMQRPTTQSGEVEVKDMYDNLNESTATLNGINELHFGEAPVSFRGLAKRFVSRTSMATPMTGVDDLPVSLYLAQNYPAPDIPFTATMRTEPANIVRYLRYAFLGIRGGYKHRVGLIGNYTTPQVSKTKVSLTIPSTVVVPDAFLTTSSFDFCKSSVNGTVEYMTSTNAGIEFEVPLYTSNLFGISFSDDPFPASNSNVEATLMRRFAVASPMRTIDVSTMFVQHDYAAAEDFSLMRFQGAPPYLYI